MSIARKLLKEIADESDGKIRIVKVPENQRPTAESLKRLDNEINAQVEKNRAMREMSHINASKRV